MRYKILKNGEEINTIVSDEVFVTMYCESNGYTFEEAPIPDQETGKNVWDELDIAYQEGVNSAYDS